MLSLRTPTIVIHNGQCRHLEGQVVCAVACGRSCLRRRERRATCRSGLLHRLRSRSGRLYVAVYRPRVDRIEPSAIVLMRVNVERHGQLFAALYVEVVYLVFAKHPEAAFAGILVVCLNYVFLRFPRVSRTRRHTAVGWQDGDNLSCDFHFVSIGYGLFVLEIIVCEITKIVLKRGTFR